jgi:tRNA (mo5U34)-methyltransferase
MCGHRRRTALRLLPPSGFDADAFYQGITLFQKWPLFEGVMANGHKDVLACMERTQVPADLSGKRVLDIAPWNGFFSFECARRGAEVVGLGPEDPEDTGFAQTCPLLEADTVSHVRANVYDLSPELVGEFDVVFFLGLIYHLRHPLLVLDKIHDVCRDTLYADAAFLDNIIPDRSIPADRHAALVEAGRPLHELPLVYYSGSDETGDPFNWFIPNLKALRAFVESSGFAVTHEVNDGGGWCWITATKTERPFVPNFEGYYAAAIARRAS